MPARIAYAPRRIPFQRLILKLGLGEPQHKVVFVALVFVGFHALAHAHGQVFLVKIVEHIVLFQLRRVKIHVSAGKISVARVHQLLNDPDIFVNIVRRGLHNVRPLDVQLPAVGEKRVGVILRDFHHGLVLAARALEHLVLALVGVAGQVTHVGNIHHALHVVADVAQILFQNVFHDIRTQVADVRKMVHRRPARIHLHDVRMIGLEFFLHAGSGIVQIHRSSPSVDVINSLSYISYNNPPPSASAESGSLVKKDRLHCQTTYYLLRKPKICYHSQGISLCEFLASAASYDKKMQPCISTQ